MIKTFGTTLAVAAAFALGTGAEAQAAPSHHVHSVPSSKVAHSRKRTSCKRTRGHRCAVRKHSKRAQARTAAAGSAGAGSAGVNVVSTTSSTAQLSWNTVPSATAARIYINGHLIDDIPATDPGSYQAQQLWPSTSFHSTVILRDAAGATVAYYTGGFTTAASSGPVPRLYSPDTFINTPIPASASVAPNSNAIVSQAIDAYSSSAAIANNASWGIPIFQASPESTSYDVGCQDYDCWVPFGPIHIPAEAQPNSGSDGHMVVLQPNGQEMDMWIAQHNGSTWTSGSRWETSDSGPAANCTTYHGCSGADVASFALAAGLIRPEEIAQGHIDHALAITTPDTRSNYIACPATNTDGQHNDPNALPIGAHVQLDPNINVAKLQIPRWEKIVAVALQQYGAYVTDTGGSIALYAESSADRPYNAWAKAGVPTDAPSIANLPLSQMRVLSMTDCDNS
jgi:hypothetical protein